jgi:tryptophan synthase alpha chain
MSRIRDVFQSGKHKTLIPYITVGYPTIDDTLKVVPLLAASGGDMVELGIPFSDPLADGATIQQASFSALKNGITPEVCLEIAGKLHKQVDIPQLFMTYYNPVFHYGLEKFSRDCVAAGVSGLIIPDLPPEEALPLEATTRKYGLDLIFLLAPNSTEKRIKLVAGQAQGFIYLVSVSGVTGVRTALPPDLADFVGRVRKATTQPLCVGFGISSPEQAAQVARLVDGVIVGSRVINLMEADDGLVSVGNFIKELRDALNELPEEKSYN